MKKDCKALHFFHEEIKTTRASRKKLTQRLRAMRLFVLWHYVLLALTAIQSGLTLFIVTNAPGVPYGATLFAIACVSLVLSLYLLFSGLRGKK